MEDKHKSIISISPHGDLIPTFPCLIVATPLQSLYDGQLNVRFEKGKAYPAFTCLVGDDETDIDHLRIHVYDLDINDESAEPSECVNYRFEDFYGLFKAEMSEIDALADNLKGFLKSKRYIK